VHARAYKSYIISPQYAPPRVRSFSVERGIDAVLVSCAPTSASPLSETNANTDVFSYSPLFTFFLTNRSPFFSLLSPSEPHEKIQGYNRRHSSFFSLPRSRRGFQILSLFFLALRAFSFKYGFSLISGTSGECFPVLCNRCKSPPPWRKSSCPSTLTP